ncbi:MAG: ribonuclease J [Caulobacterales bacterium]
MKPNKSDELVFLPLGGSGEIGMNLNAYGYGPPDHRQWVILDIGVTFGDASTPGVDVIMPDPAYLESERDNLLGIVLTHAHEDHIGAIGHLWRRLRAPVYCTPFTAFLVREKLREHDLLDEVDLRVLPMRASFELGPFHFRFVTLTHSIPEPNGVVITTPLGVVMHTGDWKIDPDPVVGDQTDAAALIEIGKNGVLAMVCDSTNALVEGSAGSEADVQTELIKLIGELKGKVAVACFASNVARLTSVIEAARQAGRQVCLAGRSMKRITAAAQTVGLLSNTGMFVSEDEAQMLPDENILYLCTGSQGEPRAALAKIAQGNNPTVKLRKGDTVVFSSRVIPGNELPIKDVQNRLVERGVNVITERDRPIHVSGHPCKDELRQMYQWVRPKIAIPVHGESRHLAEHAAIAKELQIEETVIPRNGDMIRLAPGLAELIDEAPHGRLHLDGNQLVPADDEALRERRKIAVVGHITVTVAINDRGALLSGPAICMRGLPDFDDKTEGEAIEALEEAADDAFQALKPKQKANIELVEETLERSVRRAAERIWGKRPLVDAMVLTV